MKRFLFLFGMLALLLSASAAPVKMVDYQSDVGVLTDYIITSDFSAEVINYEASNVPAFEYKVYSVQSNDIFAGAQILTPEIVWEAVANDYTSCQVKAVLEGFYSINAPPGSVKNDFNFYMAYRTNF